MQTITKMFKHYEHAEQSVHDLEAAGINSASISIVANQTNMNGDATIEEGSEAGLGAGLGAVAGGTAGLLTGLGIMAIPGVGPVVAAGWLASLAAGVLAGGATGGIVGSLIGAGVPDDHAHVYSEGLRRGGTLLSVKVEESRVDEVRAILDKYQPVDPVQLGGEYRTAGWNNFDPEGERYVTDKDLAERDMADQRLRMK
jgi:hypothetical protein